MNTRPLIALALAGLAAAALPPPARAQQIISDNFTGASVTYPWIAYDGACLTAGNGSGTIPACVGNAYYNGVTLNGGATGALPDPVGQGALRFTTTYGEAGGIISNFTFPSSQGLQITFTTVAYHGDSGGSGHDGADGMSFFLLDGAYSPYDIGAWGGSLGYTCSNTNNDGHLHPTDGTPRGYDGMRHAYLGLGIDEYGNFLNPGDNTASGPGYQWQRIGLRGAGDIAWQSLTQEYPQYYPPTMTSAQANAAVQHTCQTGLLWNYAPNNNAPTAISPSIPARDYAAIPNAYSVLPSNEPMAAESATVRGNATPITYLLKITQTGLLSFYYSYNGGAYQTVLANQNITASNGALPQSFAFGFAGSTGGSTNIHEVVCFQAAPSDSSSSSSSLNQQESSKVETGSQVYLAYFNPTNWTGSLTANNLLTSVTTGFVSVASVANWDASCVLTGVLANSTCNSTSVAGPTAAEAPSARNILTWNGSQGVPFEWGNLTAAQQTALDAGDATRTQNRLNFLRGDRSNEIPNGLELFRTREGVLSDIMDSSPSWVGPPLRTYPAVWVDNLYPSGANPENSGTTYPAFATANVTRTNVVYVGANDGLLHGFRAGAYSSAGVFNTSSVNDGYELLAYMPAYVLADIHSSTNIQEDYPNPSYGHGFYVDATPGTGDLFYNGAWHTWLVGGLGAGGSSFFALDVTNPAAFSEANAQSLVLGEWTNTVGGTIGGNTATVLSCVNAANCAQSLGETFGTPKIARFHNGQWGAVFGNGLNSANGAAGIYVMLVNPTSGAITFYYLNATNVAPSACTGGSCSPWNSVVNSASFASQGDGIAYATPADIDGDNIVDYVYAGDVKGNLWRFDLTSNNPANWAVTSGGPLFTTPGGQPITSKVVVAASASLTGASRIVIDFGTGEMIPLTNLLPAQYASGTQSLYGIWDWNMSAWNAKSPTQYAALATAPNPAISTNVLQQQSVLTSVPAASGYRAVSAYPVCWYGTTTCSGATANTQFGWYLNLPGSNEQIIYNPSLDVSTFLVNTTIPPTSSPTSCTAALASGWTLAINPITGAAFSTSFFANSSGHFVNYNGQVVSGLALNGTGSVSVVTNTFNNNQLTFLITQTTQGPQSPPINPPAAVSASRLTWAQRR